MHIFAHTPRYGTMKNEHKKNELQTFHTTSERVNYTNIEACFHYV